MASMSPSWVSNCAHMLTLYQEKEWEEPSNIPCHTVASLLSLTLEGAGQGHMRA